MTDAVLSRLAAHRESGPRKTQAREASGFEKPLSNAGVWYHLWKVLLLISALLPHMLNGKDNRPCLRYQDDTRIVTLRRGWKNPSVTVASPPRHTAVSCGDTWSTLKAVWLGTAKTVHTVHLTKQQSRTQRKKNEF